MAMKNLWRQLWNRLYTWSNRRDWFLMDWSNDDLSRMSDHMLQDIGIDPRNARRR